MALSPQDVQAFWAAAPRAAQPNTSSGIGGFLERNAGTIGSVALPGIADILSGGLALPADAALSAIGGAGGQAISNAAQHKSLTNDLLSQALSGGAGAVGGRFLGGAGGMLSKVVTRPIDKGVAKAATLAEEAPFHGVNPSILEKNNLLGENGAIANMKALKMSPSPANMKLANSLATSANGQGTLAVENALSGQKVNIGNYLDHVKKAINSESIIPGNTADKTGASTDLLNTIVNNKENNLFHGQGSLTQNANANDVMKAIRYHEGQASRFSGSGTGTVGEATGNVHQAAANYLKGALDSNPAINEAIKNTKFNPEDASKFIDHVTGLGGSPELAQHIMGSINDAKNMQELRSFQAPFVQMGNLGDASLKAAGKRFTSSANAAGGMNGLGTTFQGAAALHGSPFAMAQLANKAANSPGVLDKASSLLGKVRGVNGALAGKTAEGTVKAGGATLGKELARTAGQVYSHANQNQQPASGSPSGSSTSLADALSSVQPPDQTAATASDNSPFSGGNIQKAIAADIAMTGGKHLSDLLSLYNTFGKSQDTLTTNQKNEVTGAQKAQQALSDYASQLDSAGGGQGVLGGNIENILGGLGLGGDQAAQAHALETQRTDVAASVASALSPTGKPTASITKQVADSLPTIKDSPSVAKYKLQQLMVRIQNGEFSAQQPISGNATDLTSALGGA